MSFEHIEAALRTVCFYAPPSAKNQPVWALTGGLACQLQVRAHGTENWVRQTKDIDLYVFSNQLGHVPLGPWEVLKINDVGLEAVPPFGQINRAAVFLDVWHGFHCDNIVPELRDASELNWAGTRIPVLRPEFLFVFKTLCSFFRRPKDDFDASGLLDVFQMDGGYFSEIISRSPFKSFLPSQLEPENLCDPGFRRQIAARLCAAKLSPEQAELFAVLPADMLFPLIMTERRKNISLTVSLLLNCVETQRINQLSDAEQAFALLLACWSEPSPTIQNLRETQELLYEAVFLQESRFAIHTYFAFATRWGRYMQPLMHSEYAAKLKAGFLQSNMRNALMTQATALHETKA